MKTSPTTPRTSRKTTATVAKATPPEKKVTAPRVRRAAPKAKKKVAPTTDDVRFRAYEIYLGRNGQGDEVSDWLQAEQELMSQQAG
jgi:hypothetical protein